MANKKEKPEGKVVTKYDKKVQKRRQEELKAARSKKITVITSIVIALALITALVVTVWTNYDKVNHKYIAVDGDNISETEFDFYYGIAKQNVMNQTLYGSMTYQSYFTSYLGYDASKADSQQNYSSTDNTWYDYFANNTVTSIKEFKALLKDAEEKGFSYDSEDTDYAEFQDSISKAADSDGKSVSEYYKAVFGSHASESKLKPYVCEYLKAVAYQAKLQNDLKATDQEIADYYASNKDTYDTVDYRLFSVEAETESSQISMEQAKEKADAMAAAVTDEASFAQLCRANATSDKTDTYADDAASLVQDKTKSSMESQVADWMYADGRHAGEVSVIEDTTNNKYDVVYFISRTKPATADETISSTLLSQKYNEIITGYTDNMTVDNVHNRIKMLTEK